MASPPRERLLWTALGATWLMWLWALRRLWAFEIERYYGFGVLPLAAYLLYLRIESQPPSPDRRLPSPFTGAVAVLGAAVLGAASFVLSSNPLWTSAAWLATGGAILVTSALMAAAGGAVLARHALLPLCFTLTSLPWPAAIEAPAVSALRAFNASSSANVVSWFGVPVVAHGSVIETARGWVGIEEACSGIAGLQTALMLALFLGELRNLSWLRRATLAIGAVSLAVLVNLARTAWLTWSVANHGTAEIHNTHEIAGIVELTATIAGVSLLATAFRTRDWSPSRSPSRWRAGHQNWSTAVLAMLGFSVGATELWYRVPPSSARAHPPAKWTMVRPSPEWESVDLATGTQKVLRYDSAVNLAWRDRSSGRDWIALLLNWDSDPALRYATTHSPEICFPAAGAQLEAQLGVVPVTVGNHQVQFRRARFTANGQTFHTFSTVWDTSRAQSIDAEAEAGIAMSEARLSAIRERRRELGLEQITIVLNRCRDDDEAVQLLRAMAPRLLRPTQRG